MVTLSGLNQEPSPPIRRGGYSLANLLAGENTITLRYTLVPQSRSFNNLSSMKPEILRLSKPVLLTGRVVHVNNAGFRELL